MLKAKIILLLTLCGSYLFSMNSLTHDAMYDSEDHGAKKIFFDLPLINPSYGNKNELYERIKCSDTHCTATSLALHNALLIGDASEASRLLTDEIICDHIDIPFSAGNFKDLTPLHYACLKGLVKIAKEMIGSGANVNVAIKGTCITPLFMALMYNDTEHISITHMLLNAHADPQHDCLSSNQGWPTPLHMAAFHDNSELVGALTNSGANVNAVASSLGHEPWPSPLQLATINNNVNSIIILLKHNADISTMFNPNVYFGPSLVHFTTYYRQVEALEKLLSAGAHPHGFFISNTTTQELPLFIAISYSHGDLGRLLIRSGSKLPTDTKKFLSFYNSLPLTRSVLEQKIDNYAHLSSNNPECISFASITDEDMQEACTVAYAQEMIFTNSMREECKRRSYDINKIVTPALRFAVIEGNNARVYELINHLQFDIPASCNNILSKLLTIAIMQSTEETCAKQSAVIETLINAGAPISRASDFMHSTLSQRTGTLKVLYQNLLHRFTHLSCTIPPNSYFSLMPRDIFMYLILAYARSKKPTISACNV